eukprot:scaffold113980_cov24-Tisochrysis_lutea.AAC.12
MLASADGRVPSARRAVGSAPCASSSDTASAPAAIPECSAACSAVVCQASDETRYTSAPASSSSDVEGWDARLVHRIGVSARMKQPYGALALARPHRLDECGGRAPPRRDTCERCTVQYTSTPQLGGERGAHTAAQTHDSSHRRGARSSRQQCGGHAIPSHAWQSQKARTLEWRFIGVEELAALLFLTRPGATSVNSELLEPCVPKGAHGHGALGGRCIRVELQPASCLAIPCWLSMQREPSMPLRPPVINGHCTRRLARQRDELLALGLLKPAAAEPPRLACMKGELAQLGVPKVQDLHQSVGRRTRRRHRKALPDCRRLGECPRCNARRFKTRNDSLARSHTREPHGLGIPEVTYAKLVSNAETLTQATRGDAISGNGRRCRRFALALRRRHERKKGHRTRGQQQPPHGAIALTRCTQKERFAFSGRAGRGRPGRLEYDFVLIGLTFLGGSSDGLKRALGLSVPHHAGVAHMQAQHRWRASRVWRIAHRLSRSKQIPFGAATLAYRN